VSDSGEERRGRETDDESVRSLGALSVARVGDGDMGLWGKEGRVDGGRLNRAMPC
jgi:hypothetical protein